MPWTFIVELLKLLPSLIALAKEIYDLIKSMPPEDRKMAIQELRHADCKLDHCKMVKSIHDAKNVA
jgi:hypothetical protein